MARDSDIQKRELTQSIIYIVYIVVFCVLIPLLMLFTFGGAESQDLFLKYIFYAVVLVILYGAVFADKIVLPQKGFDISYLHDTWKGFFSGIRFVSNPFWLAFISFLIFFPVTFSSIVIFQNQFVGVASYQLNPISEVYLGGEPTAFAETLILSVIFGILSWISVKLSKGSKIIEHLLKIASVFVATFILVLYHFLVYGGNSAALVSVIFFFGVSTFLLYITGSIIPTHIWHFLNNTLIKVQQVYANSDILLALGIIFYFVTLMVFAVLATKAFNRKAYSQG